MKKKAKILLLVSLILLGSFLTFKISKVNISANEIILINQKGIAISSSFYLKLKNIGLTDAEIDVLSVDEFEKYYNMNISYTNKDVYFIKTEKLHNEDGTSEINHSYISYNDYLNEMNIQSSGYNSRIIGPDFSYDDGDDTGGGILYPSVSAYNTVDYKKITVNSTYYYDEGSNGRFFAKTTFEWLSEPIERNTDVIALNFTNNIGIGSKTLFDNQYLDFGSKMIYTDTTILTYDDASTTSSYVRREVLINGTDSGMYKYDQNAGIAVQHKLPENFGELKDPLGNIRMETHIMSDIVITLYADFVPLNTGINAVTFVGVYQHQIKQMVIDWGDISLQLSSPFISYTLGSISTEEIYEDAISKELVFEDLSSYN